MSYRCLLVDDEMLALDLLQSYLKEIPGFEVMAKIDNSINALYFLQHNEIDILFVDIEMPDINGIELVKEKKTPIVIFTTAYRNYGPEGFDLGITDYLLKPIKFDRFRLAIDKAVQQLKKEHQYYLPIIWKGQKRMILQSDILFIQGAKDYSIIQTSTQKYVHKKNIRQTALLLQIDKFIRSHKSFLVSKEQITVIKNDTILIQEHRVPIGRKYKKGISILLK